MEEAIQNIGLFKLSGHICMENNYIHYGRTVKLVEGFSSLAPPYLPPLLDDKVPPYSSTMT